MKNFGLLSVIVLLFSVNIFAQWELRYPPQPVTGITDLEFLSSDLGYAVNSAGNIIKTTNGGLNWGIVKSYQRDYLQELQFINEQVGFCISPHNYIGDSEDFIYTTDGGNFWQSTFIGVNTALTFFSISESELLQSNEEGEILKLDNFFGLWEEKYIVPKFFDWDIYVPYGDIRQFEKLNSGRMLALGSSWRAFEYDIISDSVSFLLYSDDNGNTWDTLWCDLPKVLTSFTYANENFGWMGGKENEIYSTTDGGLRWQLVYSEITPDLDSRISKIKAIDSLTVYAITTKGKFISTTNGGLNWDTTSVISFTYYESFFGLNFLNDQTGFIYGPDLWMTTNGGNNWGKIDTSIRPTFYKIQFLNTQLGFSIGGNNYFGGSSFYKTSDGGYFWAKLYDGNPNSSFNGFFMQDSLVGWVAEFNRLLKTTDGGHSWNEVDVDISLEFIRGIEFFNEELGVLYEVRQNQNDNTLNYLTTDGGVTWQKYQMSNEPFLSSFFKIKRTDPSHIWTLNQQGLWLSKDTIKTWTKISTEVDGWAGFDFLDSLNGYVAHMDGTQDKIKYTTDGGITWSILMKPYMNQTTDLVILGRDYFGRMQILLSGLDGSIFRYFEGWDYGYIENSFTNQWLYSISVFREGNTAHQWISGSGGIVLYRNDYITDVLKDDLEIPTAFNLSQNYPNPFNPTTKINWQSPISGHQTLKVYDVLGNEVATLIDEYRNAGIYEVEFEAAKLSSGVYFYQLIAGDFVSTKKMIVLK